MPAVCCCATFQSSLCHWELFRSLLCKYWHPQWASTTFCHFLSHRLNIIIHFARLFLVLLLFWMPLFPSWEDWSLVQPWHCTAQKFNKVTFCTFSTGRQECICCLVLGSILTLLNVHVSRSEIHCQYISGHLHSWGQVEVPKQADVQLEAAMASL